MENVLLDNENNIKSTVEILEVELGLSKTDVEAIRSSTPRSELRKRIIFYKHDLDYPVEQIRSLVWKDSRVLGADSGQLRKILKVFEQELEIDKKDIQEMLEKETCLLIYKAEENLRPTIRYLKEFEVGKCVGMVVRKGLSTITAPSQDKQDEIVRHRLKSLVMGEPRILSSSVEKNLKPTVAYFLNDVGLTGYEFGRIIYRRGRLLIANVERNLKPKVSFLRKELGLEIVMDGAADESSSKDLMTKVRVPPADYSTVLSNVAKRRLFAQMIATNPDILTLSIECNLSLKFDYFREVVGMTDEQLRYVFLKRPQLLSLHLERNIIPKINCFTDARGEKEEGEGGLGMSMAEVRSWITECPQTLACALDSRIRPRVRDMVMHSLFLGENVPLNFLCRTEKSWDNCLRKHS